MYHTTEKFHGQIINIHPEFSYKINPKKIKGINT